MMTRCTSLHVFSVTRMVAVQSAGFEVGLRRDLPVVCHPVAFDQQ